jgi:hypothetical protein
MLTQQAEVKRCPACGETKPLTFEHFYRAKSRLSGFRPICKPCVNIQNREYNRNHPEKAVARVTRSRNRSAESRRDHSERSKKWARENPIRLRDGRAASEFGVPRGWFEEQLERTGGRCEICGTLHRSAVYPKFLSVDHCHSTGAVRGLLCERCNFGLGHFKDDASLLKRAADYLIARSCQPLFLEEGGGC